MAQTKGIRGQGRPRDHLDTLLAALRETEPQPLLAKQAGRAVGGGV